MGNRSSSSTQPVDPPPLLSAAVVGDWSKFQEAWTGLGDKENALKLHDSQQNNVLHALFSCRGCRSPNATQCIEILNYIHSDSMSPPNTVWETYKARNNSETQHPCI